MSKRIFAHICLLLTVFLPTSLRGAQQAKKVPRIAYLTGVPLWTMNDRVKAFRQGLRELGYEEGQNIIIEWRSGEGNLD